MIIFINYFEKRLPFVSLVPGIFASQMPYEKLMFSQRRTDFHDHRSLWTTLGANVPPQNGFQRCWKESGYVPPTMPLNRDGKNHNGGWGWVDRNWRCRNYHGQSE